MYKSLPVYSCLRSNHRRYFLKKVGLKILAKFKGKHLPQGCRPEAYYNFFKKDNSSQLFFCEFCAMFKNSFLENTSEWLLLSTVTKIQQYGSHFKNIVFCKIYRFVVFSSCYVFWKCNNTSGFYSGGCFCTDFYFDTVHCKSSYNPYIERRRMRTVVYLAFAYT